LIEYAYTVDDAEPPFLLAEIVTLAAVAAPELSVTVTVIVYVPTFFKSCCRAGARAAALRDRPGDRLAAVAPVDRALVRVGGARVRESRRERDRLARAGDAARRRRGDLRPDREEVPGGHAVHVTVTEPELSDAVAAPSSASLTKTDDCPAAAVRVRPGGTVSVGRSRSSTMTFCVSTVWLPK
jgi:hypothetical protein